MAAAISAESRHQQSAHASSPLEGVAYDGSRGEFDLFRFVQSGTDDRVAEVGRAALTMRDDAGWRELRDSLSQDDLYTVCNFARRVALLAVRGDTEHLVPAWSAVGLLDLERLDWRDAAVAISLLAYGTKRSGADLAERIRHAVPASERAMRKFVHTYGRSIDEALSVGGYREIDTQDGAAFVEDHGDPFAPTVDLLSIASGVIALLEGDAYRVTGVACGAQIGTVWLPGLPSQTAEALVARARGCISISGALREEAGDTFPAQMLLACVVECRTSNDAESLARAARQPEKSDVAGVAVNLGSLCLVLIARSTVVGIEPVETATSLERLREPLANALNNA